MISNTIPSGTGGRWTLGMIVLIQLVAYNESGGPAAVISTSIAALAAIFAGICRLGVKGVQISYLRASHRFDFFCLFLGVWMDALALLTACGALARTMSGCLDAMTGGVARMWLLGRNSPANEPWPDVIGVAIVFLITGMFMLGLENTKIFSFLMITSVLGISGIVSIATWFRGNAIAWNSELLPGRLDSVLIGAALLTISFPNEFPSTGSYKLLKGIGLVLFIFISNILAAACLSTLVDFKTVKEYIAVPILAILNERHMSQVVPAVACLLVLSCSGALLELFTELYSLVVRLTTSEWKILARQIGYENRESGNPVLAIFTAGSLCAMLAFACPLQILTHIMAASHLTSTIFRAFYLLYSQFRPKFIQTQCDSSLAYSRLNTGAELSQSSAASKLKRTLQLFNRQGSTTNQIVPKSKLKKVQNDEELEREWLLLGEPPSSPRVGTAPLELQDQESSIISDAEPMTSDIECIVKDTESDSSTDIDAIVDEYRQKIKVSTAGPMDTHCVPSLATWCYALLNIIGIIVGIIMAVTGFYFQHSPLIISGCSLGFVLSLVIVWFPKNKISFYTPSAILSTISLYFGCILLLYVMDFAWPAIIFWFLSGLALFIRCDTWYCFCLDDRPHISTQNLIPNVSSKLATIRVPRPLKGSIITSRIHGHR